MGIKLEDIARAYVGIIINSNYYIIEKYYNNNCSTKLKCKSDLECGSKYVCKNKRCCKI